MRLMPARPSTSAGHRAERNTRVRILDAAQALFAESGYASVSMPTIAQASGVTAGAIYKHFDSKEDLFFEAVALRAVEARTFAAARTSNPAIDIPSAVASYSLTVLKPLRQLSLEVHAASLRNAKVRRLLSRALSGNFREIEAALRSGQNAGSIDPALDAALLSRAVTVMVMGLLHMETLLPELIDDRTWLAFLEDRVAALIGAKVGAAPGRRRGKMM